MIREFLVEAKDNGQRADVFLAEHLEETTRSAAQLLIGAGHVTCNGLPVSKSTRLSFGDKIMVCVPEPKALDVVPQDIPLEIVYEDSDLLVVNKPKGMVVHPAPGHLENTLVNALLFHCGASLSGINGVLRPGIVHRIDKDTSGLLIVAKNDFSHTRLAEQIRVHSFTREYSAVVYGGFREQEGTVDAPVGRHPTERKKMAVLPHSPSARVAVTHFFVERQYEGFSFLRLRLETGRTHQIRVHMAYLGHPVAGDPVYGPKRVITSLEGQCLHAGRIGFLHPRTGEYLEFSAPLPGYFKTFLSKLQEK